MPTAAATMQRLIRVCLFVLTCTQGTFLSAMDRPVPADLASDSTVQEALTVEAKLDPRGALPLFRQALDEHPGNAFLLQKVAQQLSDSTITSTSRDEKRELVTEALTYAEQAVKAAPKDAVCVLSVAVCYGKLGQYTDDARTRVEYSRLVRQYAEESLALDPNYDWAHHVLGRWHQEVASLNMSTKLVVRMVYGGLPEASLDEAIAHFEKAVQLAPNTVAHRVELGFAYLAAGRRADAKAAWLHALTLPKHELFDANDQRRAEAALTAQGMQKE